MTTTAARRPAGAYDAEAQAAAYEATRRSIFSSLYSMGEALPGLLAMLLIAVFANNLPGVANPFTLENLFFWLDGVVGPVNHQPLFQVLNSNFVWNPLLLGLIIANVFGVPNIWKRGLSYIHKLMPLGIIMLAPHFMIFHAFKLGAMPILICVLSLFATASITLFVARLLKLDDRQGSVIAGGLATGDPHACAILMPLIKAKGGQVVNSAICVITWGLIAMFIVPFLGQMVGIPQQYLGLYAVTAVGNGAQSLFAGYQAGYEAGRYAMWFDVGRHVIMPAGFLYVFIVMFIRKLRGRNNPEIRATRGVSSFPIWLGVFIFCWVLACLHIFKEPAHHAIFNLVKWDFSLAAAALGLSLSFRDIARPGLKGFIVTAISGLVRIVLLLAVIMISVKAGWLPA